MILTKKPIIHKDSIIGFRDLKYDEIVEYNVLSLSNTKEFNDYIERFKLSMKSLSIFSKVQMEDIKMSTNRLTRTVEKFKSNMDKYFR